MTRYEPLTPVFSTEAMRAADRATIEEFGIPGFTLMEAAARGAVDAIEERCRAGRALNVLVLAGKGNNGGDGLAIARHLAGRAANVLVVTLAGAGDASPEAKQNLALLRQIKDSELCMLDVLEVNDGTDLEDLKQQVGQWTRFGTNVCVDALLGIGARGELREPLATIVDFWMDCDTVFAIDVPTGIDSDTGAELDVTVVKADATITMAGPKPGLLFGEGRELAGEIITVDIGIPRHIEERALTMEGSARMATDDFVRFHLPRRKTTAHKGSVGLALVVAGSDDFSGAAVLASMAAGRIGAGYVTCATTPTVRTAIDAQSPPTATVGLPVTEGGGIAAAAVEEVVARATRARALLMGPGLGRDPETVRFVREVLARVDVPTVIDADGLNALCEGGLDEFPADVRGRWVLTPHLGEFRRLVRAAGVEPETLDLERRTWLVREWAARLGVALMLKGAPTVTAAPDGQVFVARSVEPALASAGSGDVLAGMTVGLIAQGVPTLEAAVCAQHIGAQVAGEWTRHRAERAMQPTDTIEALPQVLRERFELES